MNILVTGGTGFIGSHLIDALLAKNDTQVSALVRNPDRLKWPAAKSRVRILQGDLFSVPQLPYPIDIVFHLAGLTKALKSNDYYTVNQKGTASLFRSLRRQSAAPRFVHLSSLAAGGPAGPDRPAREDDPPRPVSPYGESKLLAEEEVLRHKADMPVIILRVAAVFGPRDEDFLSYFRMVRKGWVPLFGPGKKFLSLVYVHDVVRAMEIAAEAMAASSLSGEIFNIADPKPYAWEDFGEAASLALGRSVRHLRIPIWAAEAAGSVSETVSHLVGRPTPINRSKIRDMKACGWVADVRKAKALLGFETRFPLDDAIRETIAWYGRNGWLRAPVIAS